MATLNLSGAKCLKKHQASACTDVTGFGILGHASLLASCQRNKVSFRIRKLPIIRNLFRLDKVARDFKLLEGRSAETSGGLFLCLDEARVPEFLREMQEAGHTCHVIGDVIEGNNDAVIEKDVKIIECD